jgi:hypothetical protein
VLNFIEHVTSTPNISKLEGWMICTMIKAWNWVFFQRITSYLYLSSTWRNIHFGLLCSIILNFIETCNSHSKTNLVRRLNVLLCSSVWIKLVYHRIIPISYYFRYGQIFILAHIMLNFIQSCNLHANTNLVRWLRVQCSSFIIKSLFHRIISYYLPISIWRNINSNS